MYLPIYICAMRVKIRCSESTSNLGEQGYRNVPCLLEVSSTVVQSGSQSTQQRKSTPKFGPNTNHRGGLPGKSVKSTPVQRCRGIVRQSDPVSTVEAIFLVDQIPVSASSDKYSLSIRSRQHCLLIKNPTSDTKCHASTTAKITPDESRINIDDLLMVKMKSNVKRQMARTVLPYQRVQ